MCPCRMVIMPVGKQHSAHIFGRQAQFIQGKEHVTPTRIHPCIHENDSCWRGYDIGTGEIGNASHTPDGRSHWKHLWFEHSRLLLTCNYVRVLNSRVITA